MPKTMTISTSKDVFGSKVLASILILATALFMASIMPGTAHAQTTLFADGFESGDTSEWHNSSDGWDVVGDDAAEGAFKARASNPFNNEEDDVLEFDTLVKEVSTEGYEDLTLMFSYMTTDFEPDDEILLQIRTEDDGDWETIVTGTDGDERDNWTEVSFDLPESAEDNDDFAFRFISHLDSEADEFHLDAVVLTGEEIPSEDDDENGDEEDDRSALLRVIEQILVSFETGGSDIEIHIDLDETTEDDVIEALAVLLGLTENAVEDLIVSDEDDDNGNGNGNDDGDDNDNENGNNDDDENDNGGNGVNGDADVSGTIQSITATVWDDSAGVEVDTDETFDWLSLDTTDHDEIIEEVAEWLGIDEDTVEDHITFEEG